MQEKWYASKLDIAERRLYNFAKQQTIMFLAFVCFIVLLCAGIIVGIVIGETELLDAGIDDSTRKSWREMVDELNADLVQRNSSTKEYNYI